MSKELENGSGILEEFSHDQFERLRVQLRWMMLISWMMPIKSFASFILVKYV